MLEHVLEEVEQPVVGVLGVVDDQRRRARRRPATRSKNAVQAANSSSRVNVPASRGAEQHGEPGPEPGPLSLVGHVLVQPGLRALVERRRRCRSRSSPSRPGPPRPAPRRRRPRRRTRQRPRCQRTSRCRPSTYFSNSQPSRDLPDAGLASTTTSEAGCAPRARVEQLLDQAQLAVAAGERRLEPVDPLDAADRRRRPTAAANSRTGSALPLSSCSPASVVGDRCRGQRPGRLVDPDLTGLGRRLHPGRGVHRVTGHHALARRAEGHGDLAGDDADAHRQAGGADVLAQRRRPSRPARARLEPLVRRRPRARPARPRRPSPHRR